MQGKKTLMWKGACKFPYFGHVLSVFKVEDFHPFRGWVPFSIQFKIQERGPRWRVHGGLFDV